MSKKSLARDIMEVEITEKFEGRQAFYVGGVYKGMRKTGDKIYLSSAQFETAKDRVKPVPVPVEPGTKDGGEGGE